MSEYFRAGLKGKFLLPLVVLIGILSLAPPAQANVYATNIKLNDSIGNITTVVGSGVSISFILNENASSGVTIEVLSGINPLRTITIAGGSPGTTRGLNTVMWDGQDTGANNVPPGTYTVSIAAASSGYSDWTQLTTDADPNTYVRDGRGIAIDRNPGSPYYGRVFVANSDVGVNPATTPGDAVGILKFNADASTPDDGIVSTGDHNWPGNELGPRQLEVSQDDRVHVTDLANDGELYSWDPAFSTNSFIPVLQLANKPPGARLNGLALNRQGSNTQLWMSDNLSNNGILKWILGPNGACDPGDLGTMVVGLGDTNTGLSLPCEDIAVDNVGNIYACQSVTVSSNTTPRVFRFPAYDPSTNGGIPEAIANWAVGGGDDTFGGARGIAVDPTGRYVAVSFEGILVDGFYTRGNTKILYATNGANAVDIDLNLPIQGDYSHQDTGCAWDAVGNLYYIDNYWGSWRAVSPPGTNQSTTLAPGAIQIVARPPEITGISVSGGFVGIAFTGPTNDLPAAFTLLSAGTPPGPYSTTAGATITGSNGVFSATAPTNGAMQFYRIQR